MVTGYEALLFVHILAAVVWVGGGAATQFYAIRAMGSTDPGRLAGFAKDAEWVGMRVFMPASLVVLGAGFGLVAKGDWSLGTFWVAFGLGAMAASALTGALFLGPEAGRIGKLIDAHGFVFLNEGLDGADRKIELAQQLDHLEPLHVIHGVDAEAPDALRLQKAGALIVAHGLGLEARVFRNLADQPLRVGMCEI
mgnify:CR=1 FL=1